MPEKNSPDTSSTPATREDDRLVAEWIEASKAKFALKGELDQPQAIRPSAAQVKLIKAAKAAGDLCNGLILALRKHRKASRNS